MVKFMDYAPNGNYSLQAIIYKTEILLLPHRSVLFRVSTPFREDELAHGPIDKFRWLDESTDASALNSNESSSSMKCAHEMEKYIAEVKYRREKNDKIAELELELKRLEQRNFRIEEDNTLLRRTVEKGFYAGGCERVNSLDKENKDLREQIVRLQSGKGALQEAFERSSLESGKKIQRLNKEITRLQSPESENTKLQKEIESLKSKLRFYRDHDSENKDLREQIARLQSDKESLQTLNKDNVRIQSATSCDLRLRLQRLQDEIDQCKIENKKLRKDADKYKRIAEDRWELRQALLVDKNKEIAEITTSRDYLSRLRHTICPTKKYWLDEVNQKHSDKLKEVVKALGKKHVAKREKLIAEKESFAKRVFELTEEIYALNTQEYSSSQVNSLKLQLAAEKRISQKYARDLHERDTQQSVLTAM